MNVTLQEWMGDDLFVANAARKSFGAEFTEFRTIEDGPRTPNGRSDEELINDLVRDGHWLPFRHPHITFACSDALPVARQLGKHQVGLNWSEISRRYKTKGIEFTYLHGTWRYDIKDRKQGSGELMPEPLQESLANIQNRNITNALNDYQEALDLGAAPEQARYLLPQSMNAEWTWTGSLLAWAHLYKQRNHPDAQKETQAFAQAISQELHKLYPYSWKALIGE